MEDHLQITDFIGWVWLWSLAGLLTTCLALVLGWYVDDKASRHITYDKPLFNKFQEQGGGMSMELDGDVSYPKRAVGSISFQMPSGDVLGFDFALFSPGLRKNLLSMSYTTNVQWTIAFEGQ